MLKKFGIMNFTLVGPLAAVGSGIETPTQSADLSVQLGTPSLPDKTAISLDSQMALDETTRRPRRQAPSLPCPACGMG
jgi:hypothetical protein